MISRFLSTFFLFAVISFSYSQPINNTIDSAIPIVPSPQNSNCDSSNTFTLPFSTDGTTGNFPGSCSYIIGPNDWVILEATQDQFFKWTATSQFLLWKAINNVGIIIYDNSYNRITCATDHYLFNTIPLSGWNIGDELIIQIFSTYSTQDPIFCLKTTDIPINTTINNAIPFNLSPEGTPCLGPNFALPFSTDGTLLADGKSQYFTWTATSLSLKWEITNIDDYLPGGSINYIFMPGLIILGSSGNIIDRSVSDHPVFYSGTADDYDQDNILSGWNIGDNLVLQIQNGSYNALIGSQLTADFDFEEDLFFCLEERNSLSLTDNNIESIKIYPNPTNSILNIQSPEVAIDKIQLYNIRGKLILESELLYNTIDVSEMTSGVYLLKLYSEEKQTTRKIIIN